MDKVAGMALLPFVLLVIVYGYFIGEKEQSKEIWEWWKSLMTNKQPY